MEMATVADEAFRSAPAPAPTPVLLPKRAVLRANREVMAAASKPQPWLFDREGYFACSPGIASDVVSAPPRNSWEKMHRAANRWSHFPKPPDQGFHFGLLGLNEARLTVAAKEQMRVPLSLVSPPPP